MIISTFQNLLRMFLLVLVVFACLSCSSTDEQSSDSQDELQVSDDQSDGDISGEEGEQLAEKSPITDDGYDDDWNNMGTQQQQKQQAAKKNDTNEYQQQNSSNNGLNAKQETQGQYTNDLVDENPAQQYQPGQQYNEAPFQQEAQIAPAANYSDAAVEYEDAAPVPQEQPLGEVPVGGPLLRNEILAQKASLWWLGYDYAPNDSVIRLELVTRGTPKYNIFQERNRADQPELVIRFFNTEVRNKVSRDIDASEFKSPVAFVRVRPDPDEENVDVIMTLRDAVRPRMYARNGNILLTFPIPDHYFGNSTIGDAPVAVADILPDVNIMPEIDQTSAIPEGLKVARAYVPNPAAVVFQDAPADGGTEVATGTLDPEIRQYDEAGLPSDFDNSAAIGTISDGNTYGENSDYGGNTYDTIGNSDNYSNGLNANSANYEAPLGNYGDGYGAVAPAAVQPAPVVAPTAQPPAGAQPETNTDEGDENYENSQQGAYEIQDESELLDGDGSLDDFDDGEGESEYEIDKFDVRAPNDGIQNYVVTAFSMLSVAQDEYADEVEGDGGDYETDGGGNYQAQGQYGANYSQGQDDGNYSQGQGGFADYSQEAVGDQQGQQAQGNYNLDAGGNNYGEQQAEGNAQYQYQQENANAQSTSQGSDFPGSNAANYNYGGDNVFDEALDQEAANGNYGQVNDAGTQNSTNGYGATNGYAASNNYAAGEGNIDNTASDYAGEELEGSISPVAPERVENDKVLSMDFRGAPLKEVIRMLSEESGINFVLSPTVQDRQIFLSFNKVTFNNALQALLKSNSLGMVEIGTGLVRIDTLEAIATDEVQREEARKAQALATPTQILIIRLSHAKAAEAKTMLEGMLTKIGGGDDRLKVDTDVRTNSLIINAKPSDLSTIKQLVERIDLATPQVKIASRIVEVTATNEDAFGISWDSGLNMDQGRGLGFGNLVFPNNSLSAYSIDAGGTGKTAGQFGFNFGAINNVTGLDLALAMEESRGTSQVLQTSNIIVQDNMPATIVAGRTDTFGFGFTADTGGTREPDVVEYNLTMAVTPSIAADGAVQMKLDISSMTPAKAAAGTVASTNNRIINTTLYRQSGQTAVIGGVYNTNKSTLVRGVPFFSKIPIIGALFRESSESDSRKELLVMVTPTILSGGTTAGDNSSVGGGDYNISTQGNQYNQSNFSNGGQEGDYGLNGSQQGTGGSNYGGNQAGYESNYGNNQSGGQGNYDLSGETNQGGNYELGQQQGQQQGQSQYQDSTQQYQQGQQSGQGNYQGDVGQQAGNQQNGGSYENF